MPDFGSPVAQNVNVNPNQGIQTLSGLLSLQQQQLGIQTSQQQLQQQQVQTQMVQRQQQARTFLTGMMQSKKDEQGNSILDATGEPDPAKVTAAVARNIPTDLAQPIIQSVLKSETDKVGLEASASSLDTQQRAMLMGPVQAAALNPNAKSGDINAGIDNLVSAHPEMSNAAGYLKGLVAHLDNVPPDKRASAIQTIAAHMQGGAGVQTQPIPAEKDVGPALVQGITAPAVAGGGFTPSTQIGKAPGPQVVPLPNNQVGILDSSGHLRVAPMTGGAPAQPGVQPGGPARIGVINGRARTAQDDAPSPNAPGAVQQQFKSAAEEAQRLVTTTRNSDADYGTNMTIADNIRRLSANANTGPGTAEWNRTMGLVTSRLGGSQQVANYQTLGAFLDRQSAQLRTQMGLPETNAGQAEAQMISGNTEYQRGAIQAKNNLNEALTEGMHQFRHGLDRGEQFTGTPSPQAVNQYKSAWAQNFDPTAEEYRLAKMRGDATTVNQIVSRLNPQQRTELAQKGRNLDQLANGYLPQ